MTRWPSGDCMSSVTVPEMGGWVRPLRKKESYRKRASVKVTTESAWCGSEVSVDSLTTG